MIELGTDELIFSAPEVHADARCQVEFQRTLRVPDDGLDYPLPAGLGAFPVEHVDDHTARVPSTWSRHGGVMLPMYAAEAMWLSFSTDGYPWALKIAAGMINAVSGEGWTMNLHSRAGDPSRERDEASSGRGQDYVVLPDQPWLDGFNTGDDSIRQFVAMPLGGGFTAEEQLTGQAIFGGLQLLAYPMKASAYEKLQRSWRVRPMLESPLQMDVCMAAAPPDMGLGAGGRITQDITEDPYGVDSWDLDHPSRCYVHLARAEQWPALTGRATPTKPPTAKDYLENGLPWFDYAAQGSAVPAADPLASLRSVHEHAAQNGLDITDNDSIPIDRVVRLGRRGGRRPVGSSW